MTDQDKFNEWANQFEPESDRWEDMGRDEVFIAGLNAGRAEMPEQANEAIRRLKAFVITNHGPDAKVLEQVNELLFAGRKTQTSKANQVQDDS
jgi:hypothetical protein